MIPEFRWHVGARSEACRITNRVGHFECITYQLFNLEGPARTVVTLSRGTLRPGALLRINSACLTGEVFGDQSCDCAWQLMRALEMIAEADNGLVIYAPFEDGRGSGTLHKINSLAVMQDTGMTSSAAFAALGLPVDAREYGYAAALLVHLRLTRVGCITNNPAKVRALEHAGIEVDRIVPIVARHRLDLRRLYADKVWHQQHTIDLSPFSPEANGA
jgi:GTP cyclohydrolase II